MSLLWLFGFIHFQLLLVSNMRIGFHQDSESTPATNSPQARQIACRGTYTFRKCVRPLVAGLAQFKIEILSTPSFTTLSTSGNKTCTPMCWTWMRANWRQFVIVIRFISPCRIRGTPILNCDIPAEYSQRNGQVAFSLMYCTPWAALGCCCVIFFALFSFDLFENKNFFRCSVRYTRCWVIPGGYLPRSLSSVLCNDFMIATVSLNHEVSFS